MNGFKSRKVEVEKIINELGFKELKLDSLIDFLIIKAYQIGYVDGVLGERCDRHKGMNVNQIFKLALERARESLKDLRRKETSK